jgi:hypothetical protein
MESTINCQLHRGTIEAFKGDKTVSPWSGSSATLLNEVGEFGEDEKILTKEERGWGR